MIEKMFKGKIDIHTAIKFIVAVIILIYLLSLVEPKRMLAVLEGANPTLIFLGIILAPLNVVWLYFRWRSLTSFFEQERTIPKKEVLGSVLSGITLRLTTPGGLGEFGRILYIRELSRTKLFALTVVDNLSSFFITGIFGPIGLAYIFGIWYLLLIPVGLIILLAAFFLYRRRIDISQWRLLRWKIIPVKFRLVEFWETIKVLPISRIIFVLFISAVMFFCYSFQFYLLITAFEDISPVDGFASISAIMFVKSILPISFGDLGIREGASILMLGKFGVSRAAALNASLLLFSFNLLVPAIIGSVFITGFKWRSSKSEAE